MTRTTNNAVFLERRAYHKRRMRDLARAVPVFGVILWCIPLLWRQSVDVTEGSSNSDAVVYIFAVWILLIILAAGISKAVKSDDVASTDTDPR